MIKTDSVLQKALNAISYKYSRYENITDEQKMARANELFDAYEAFDKPAKTFWHISCPYPGTDGKAFTIIGRVDAKDVENPAYLPMWRIQLDDMTDAIAYPEEIFESAMCDNGREIGYIYNKEIYERGFRLSPVFHSANSIGSDIHDMQPFALVRKRPDEKWTIMFEDGDTYNASAEEIFERVVG